MPRSVTSRTASRPTSRRSSLRLGRRLSGGRRNSRRSSAASSDTEDAPRGTQKNPIHVLSRDTPIGWAVIQKAVDEFDKDQIEGIKNDIDTLLVFIGLFSAVLSAFLVVAVALLQEDVPGATLTTLRQMSAQNVNYTIQGDFIISTSPVSTSSPPFEPSINAIRINNLWAASLVISLATASFGILVKQWLREYMKFVTSFPQGRLRIRKFRRAGLETWKVLTIAAFLPLLLQLALGLFFIGLCFYAAELHSSVRNTTLPLVAGWGFIFFFVTVSPLFSAHCPYKTPALDSLVVAMRPHIHASILTLWITFVRALKRLAGRIHRNAPRYSIERIAKMVIDRAEGYINRHKDCNGPYDEAAAAKHEAGDLDIMVDADELQGNDEIVGTAMVDALQQITPSPEDIIGFVLKMLQHRVPWEGSFETEPEIINCSMAATRALDSIQSLLEQHLPVNKISKAYGEGAGSQQVPSWTAALYLSIGMSHGYGSVPSLLWEPSDERLRVFVDVAVSEPSEPRLKSLLHLACQSCWESNLGLVQSLGQIKCVVEPFFQKLELTDSFASDGDCAPWREVLNPNSLHDTVVFLVDLLRNDTAAQDSEWSNTHHDALSLIIKLIATWRWGFNDDIVSILRMVFSSKSDAAAVELLTLLIKFYPNLLSLYMNREDFGANAAALSHFTTTIETIAATSPDQLTRLSVLKACESLTEAVHHHHRGYIRDTALTESWRGIFAAMTSLVQAMPVFEEATDEETLQVGWCFAWLSSIDSWDEIGNRDDEVRYSIWHAEFKPEESHVPDGFYATLMRIALPETRYWRMKRLQGMDPQEREEAANDIDSYLRKSAAEYSEDNAAGRSMACGEGSGVGAGTADGPGGVDAPSEAEDGRDSGNCTNRADAPGWPEEPGNPGNDSAIVAEGLQPGANVALDLESDGCGLGTDGDNGDEQHEAALEDTAGRDSEAAVLPYTEPPSDVKIDDVNPSCQRRAW